MPLVTCRRVSKRMTPTRPDELPLDHRPSLCPTHTGSSRADHYLPSWSQVDHQRYRLRDTPDHGTHLDACLACQHTERAAWQLRDSNRDRGRATILVSTETCILASLAEGAYLSRVAESNRRAMASVRRFSHEQELLRVDTAMKSPPRDHNGEF